MLARPSEAPRRAEVPPPVFVALVTGAASGIGRATALRLAGSGAALALLDRDADGVAAVADEALDAGAADALTFAADVASADGFERAFAAATDRLGPLDALACAAGILEPAGLADTTADSWQRHFDVNTTGVLHCLQAARPRPRLRDGGAVVVLASERAVAKYGLEPMARIIGSAAAGVEPRIMGIGPIPAVRKVLARHDLTIADLDIVELNEAFAAQALAVLRDLGLPDDAEFVNPNGGAIALGHPLGASGARLVLTSAIELQNRQAKRAIATMCVGVGQGVAVLIERT